MLRSDHSAFLSGSPFLRRLQLGTGLLAAALALGCTPKIGDDCTVSTNCSTTGDRLCDVTQPGGYCTKFNCEPGGCPEDSVCVNFGTKLSPISGCQASQANSPYKRSFCMANCGSDGDCRSGYVCREPEYFRAVLAEHSSGQKVCGVEPNPTPMANSSEVCIGADSGSEQSGGSGGASGAAMAGSPAVGGSAGAAGDSAAGDGGTGG